MWVSQVLQLQFATLFSSYVLKHRTKQHPVFMAYILFAPWAMMMEAARTSEMSANVYQTTRRNSPKDSNFHTRRRDNLKSHLVSLYGIGSQTVCRDTLVCREGPRGVS
jgi:hypothetical protein